MQGLLRKPRVSVGYAGAVLFFAGQFSLFTYLRPFLEQVTHADGSLVSLMLLVVGAMGFAGTVLIGRAIGNRLHLLLAVLPTIMAIVALSLALGGSSVSLTIALLAIWGFTGTAAPVAWWTWVTRAAPDDAEAGGGLMVASAQIGLIAGAMFGGLAFDTLGAVATFLGSSIILLLASLVALASGPRSERACAPDNAGCNARTLAAD